jgi:hypothetical protein
MHVIFIWCLGVNSHDNLSACYQAFNIREREMRILTTIGVFFFVMATAGKLLRVAAIGNPALMTLLAAAANDSVTNGHR